MREEFIKLTLPNCIRVHYNGPMGGYGQTESEARKYLANNLRRLAKEVMDKNTRFVELSCEPF
jgi:hypothetical protein